jgi:hypothetical protein
MSTFIGISFIILGIIIIIIIGHNMSNWETRYLLRVKSYGTGISFIGMGILNIIYKLFP